MSGREVYVLYPRGRESGGPEALHQLVDSVRRQGGSAWLVPYDESKGSRRVSAYEVYDAPERYTIPDHSQVVVVAGESRPSRLSPYKRAARHVWWLSVDYSYWFAGYGRVRARPYEPRVGFRSSKGVDKALLGRDLYRAARYPVGAYDNLTQSRYAWAMVNAVAPIPPRMLGDYTSLEYLEAGTVGRRASRGRQPRVAYNAVKASAVTERVAASLPHYEFVPLKGMTRAELRRELQLCDVYLDLGAHPGKDRLPRESATLGCVVALATRGSGAFVEDTPVPDEHRVRTGAGFLSAAKRTLEFIAQDIDAAWVAQAAYRSSIREERKHFDAQVRDIFLVS